MAGPLSHIRVLDLSRILAGPWAGQVLADLGADVIKVERPGAGDDTRGWGPPFLDDARGAGTRYAGYFLAVNRGKRSITANLDKAAGRDIVRKLAARADILLENYKVGTLARFALGYEDLRAVNPRLIYCSVSGFGQSGPRRDQVAYDFVIQAMGGLMSVTGERDGQPGGGPQKVGVPIVDLMTGMYAAVAVLAALARREVSGKGECIDLAMLDVQVAFLANQAMNYLVTGSAPQRTGNAHPNIQPQQVFACRDGDVVLAIGNDAQFARFCEVIGRAQLARDERFAANAARVRNQEALAALIARAFSGMARHDLIAKLGQADVPCGPINSIPEVFRDPQVVHRGMRIDIGAVPQVASPFRFAEAPIAYDRPPPLLGEHTVEILGELGMSAAQIEQLRTDGVL
jgi:crotonobetainyl-CoA:carnitine CoA-transferase CaiB-like acyl-CoA transferase